MLKPECVFCASDNAKLVAGNTWHPVATDHGPFDLYKCNHCGSAFTFPLPSEDQLTALYNRFADGLIPATRDIREEYPLDAWYQQCLQHALKRSGKSYESGSVFSWIDLGAGKGELSKQIAQQFPASKGCAVDFHNKPDQLKQLGNIEWQSIDMNGDDFATALNGNADLIFIITVLEHLRRPDVFLRNALRLLKPGGCLYLTTPQYGSLASNLLGKRWPYIIPGEHLNIPSLRGMEILAKRSAEDVGQKNNLIVKVRPTVIPYAAGYYAKHFGLNFLTAVLPKKFLLRIPTGILEASIITAR